MQKTRIILAIFSATIQLVNAQNKKETGIYFSAVIGTQTNNFKKQFVADIDSPLPLWCHTKHFPFLLRAREVL